MSRFEINNPQNPQYQFVYGVDHITGPFVQVHDNCCEDEDDTLIVRVDNQGVCRYKEIHPHMQQVVLSQLDQQFTAARHQGNVYPNLAVDDIGRLAKAFEIPLTMADIYSNLD